jgi:hypothetical protein
LGPPDNIIYNTGKNFVFIEFKQYTKSIIIQITEIPVEAYNSIRKIKRYHTFLRQAYKIIYNELRDTSTKTSLQITIKTINNSAGPDGIIPTFFVFSIYPRIIENSVPSLIITKRTKTIYKTTKKIRYFYAKQQVIDTLVIRNSPNTTITLELLI